MERAIERGVDFFFAVDPASAQYPCGYAAQPSHDWWKFGFPVFYITDLLQLAEALVNLGFGSDPRLSNTIALIRDKQDPEGYWRLEFSYSGKIWNDFGEKKTTECLGDDQGIAGIKKDLRKTRLNFPVSSTFVSSV